MNRIELSDEERELLMQVLERRERDMEVEILHTDHVEFRKLLKLRMKLLHGLMAKVAAHPMAMAA